MIPKGVSAIKGVCNLTTRPGPIAERNRHLKLYKLAAERDHLLKKLLWVNRQKDQAEKRLAEIAQSQFQLQSQSRQSHLEDRERTWLPALSGKEYTLTPLRGQVVRY